MIMHPYDRIFQAHFKRWVVSENARRHVSWMFLNAPPLSIHSLSVHGVECRRAHELAGALDVDVLRLPYSRVTIWHVFV